MRGTRKNVSRNVLDASPRGQRSILPSGIRDTPLTRITIGNSHQVGGSYASKFNKRGEAHRDTKHQRSTRKRVKLTTDIAYLTTGTCRTLCQAAQEQKRHYRVSRRRDIRAPHSESGIHPRSPPRTGQPTCQAYLLTEPRTFIGAIFMIDRGIAYGVARVSSWTMYSSHVIGSAQRNRSHQGGVSRSPPCT